MKFVYKRDFLPPFLLLRIITYNMTLKAIFDLFFHYNLIILLALQ